jgi:hypothetical protein
LWSSKIQHFQAKSPTVQAVGVFNKKMEEEEGQGSSSEIEVDEQKKMVIWIG